MKAETYIEKQTFYKKWINYLSASERNELEELLDSYARIQIEKDR